MADLEKKRMNLELIKVRAARAELEFRVEERLDEIERLKESIQKQVEHEKMLEDKIDGK